MTASPTELDGAFTVDVEDYFHVSAFADRIAPEDWGRFDCRVERNTHVLLDLAARHQTRATFFILGWVADLYPRLLRDIQSAGHEIGCHSHWHQLVYDLGPNRFRADLIQSRDSLEQTIGQPVRLYRAPSFSVTDRSLWALEILVEEGFEVDSSIYPVRHDRYGIPSAPTAPHHILTPAGRITEFPGMVCDLGALRVPAGGGGYLRLLPWSVTRTLLQHIRRQQRPLNVYIHPWEIDPQQPRLAASWKSRFRHYQNLSTTLPKLEAMLSEFRLGTISDVLSQPSFRRSADVGTRAESARSPEVAGLAVDHAMSFGQFV